MVTGSKQVRFYAGAPLITADGHRIGVLSVMDAEPREGLSDARATPVIAFTAGAEREKTAHYLGRA